MKNNKRWFFLIAMVTVASLATGSYAISGFKNQFGFSGKGMIKERVLSKMDYTVQELKLTPAQQNEYAAIRDRMSTDMDNMREKHVATRDAMRAQVDSGNPDIKAMAEKMKKEVALMSGFATAQIDHLVEVYDILDASQQKEFAAMLKEKMDKKHRFHRDDD